MNVAKKYFYILGQTEKCEPTSRSLKLLMVEEEMQEASESKDL